jgi:2-polyprenyl-6-methoxyphenol hydroxylase-like FAD-dependent oxidoreductase
MADFDDNTDFGSEAHLYFSRRGSVESFPLPDGKRRWVVLMQPRSDPDEELAALARRVEAEAGIDVTIGSPSFQSRFTPERILCRRFERGRVFLAGDAAHVMSPIGGQGMNTGFADAKLLADTLLRIGDRALRPGHPATRYSRARRRAFRIASARAARGMWLGTRQGKAASAVRSLFIRRVLMRRPLRSRLAPYFAMLTIPSDTVICGERRGAPNGAGGGP